MYELFIGNKNYSSWSLRPWVLMKERGIRFPGAPGAVRCRHSYTKFRAFSPTGRVPCLRDGDDRRLGLAGDRRVSRGSSPGLWPTDKTARAWARCAAAEMHSGFGMLRQVCTMNVGLAGAPARTTRRPRSRHRAHRRTLERGAGTLRRPFPRGLGVHDRRCVLLPRGISRAHLWLAAERSGGRLCCASARTRRDARMGSRGAGRAMA